MRLDTTEKRAAARAAFWSSTFWVTVATFTHADGSEARVLRSTKTGKITAAGFVGTAGKPEFFYSYRDQAAAEQKCRDLIAGRDQYAALKAEMRARRKTEAADTTKGYLSCAETAVMVREALARHLPGLKFSVRSNNYAGGASIDVSWTDGPRTAVVEPIVKRFAGATFDGMTDCKEYHSDVLVSETGMRVVHFGADFVFCHRTETDWDARHAAALAMIRERCHCEGAEPNMRFGNYWINDLASGVVRDTDYREADGLERAFRRVVLRDREA